MQWFFLFPCEFESSGSSANTFGEFLPMEGLANLAVCLDIRMFSCGTVDKRNSRIGWTFSLFRWTSRTVFGFRSPNWSVRYPSKPSQGKCNNLITQSWNSVIGFEQIVCNVHSAETAWQSNFSLCLLSHWCLITLSV